MAENDVVRFPGHHLDPSAQEFRPTFPPQHHHFPFLSPPPHPPPQHPPFVPELFFPTPQPPPSLPPPLTYMTPTVPPSQAYLPPSIPPPASSPTRAVLLTAVPPDVSESLVRRELEIFGDVRAVQMGRVSEGIVTVHFYDLRAAHAALDAVREQHMQHQNRLRIHYSTILAGNYSFSGGPPPPPPPPPSPGLISGRAVWAQFTIPATNAFPDGQNQGTLVIFNLNPTVSALTLKGIFQTFGAVKELRETPMKRQQRFVEFYDVRDASTALAQMNGKEINGRSVMIEFSRPGGHSNKKFNNYHHHQFNNLNFHHNNTSNQLHIAKPLPSPPPQPQPPLFPLRNRRTSPKQNNVRRRRSSPMSSEESLEIAMSGLALRNANGTTTTTEKGRNNVGSRKGNGNGNENCSSSGSKQQQQPFTAAAVKTKPWKGRQKNFDPRFLIKEDAIVEESGCKDTRTTIMIKNIPNKYSQKLVLNMLDNHCIHCNEQIAVAGDNQPLSSYDFVYLPIDFNNKCNVGYGFVNMTSPEATLRLYKSFHHQHWEVFNSRKICEVTYARVQGLEALKEHFKNSKFACENDEYLPVVFSPPRDGRDLTAPLPIVFSTTVAASPTLEHECTDVDASDFTSTTTLPHPDELYDHDHIDNADDHIILTSTIIECDIDHDDESSSNSSSSNGGGGVIIVNDDGSSNNSSMGCSIAD